MKLIITGGHHSSALPVINLIKKLYPDWELFWFGHRHSLKNDKNDTLEYKEITALNIPFYELQTGKVYRVYNPLSFLKVFRGFYQAYTQLKKIKPDLIMSFGGYLAVPVVVAGYLLKIKSITHEQTLVVGYANKVISHFAQKIMLSWESSKIYFPEYKTVTTGLPLREEIFSVLSDDFTAGNNLPYLYITGGKSGSHCINEVVRKSLPELLKKYNVIHQCGDYSILNDYENLNNTYQELKSKSNESYEGVYFCRKFIFANQIGEAYKKSSVVVARSGAHTIAELVALKKKSVLIPIPWVSHNEQQVNAEFVRKLGLAIILPEQDLTEESFIKSIDAAFNLPEVSVDNSFPELCQKAAQNILNEVLLAHKTQKA